jgi:hypothetical protein
MCRYAYKIYKSHFACFECRKAFKKTALEDYVKHKGLDSAYHQITKVFGSPKRRRNKEQELGITYEEIKEQYFADVSCCPECGGTMAAMGLDFKAPKHTDVEAWEIVAKLYEKGFAFKGCGCYVGYDPPTKLSELDAWLGKHMKKSEGEKLLEVIVKKHP